MQPEGMQPGEERFGPSPEMMPGGARAAGAQAEQVPEVAWMLTSEDLVRVLCERFRAAATARARAAGMAGPPSAGEEAGHGLPFKLRTDATVVAEYHLDWPSGEQQRLSGVPLGQLTLHYVRTEQDAAKLVTLESFYKRQLDFPNTQVHPIESGSWMESLEPVPDTDKKRSIDLMFTVTVPVSAELDKKKDLPVTTEILCIDMKDPQATGGGG